MFGAIFFSTVVLAAQPSKRPTDAQRGEELYRRHCVVCHGATNDGRGPIASELARPIPSLIGKVTIDDEASRLVLKGRGAMPGYEATFDKPDAVRVLKYMKTLTVENPMPDVATAPVPKAVKNKKLEKLKEER